MSKICIVGLWHQGVVLSACLADMGHEVVGIDENINTITLLKCGNSPIYEPKLGAIIKRNLKTENLRYTSEYDDGIDWADYVYIAIDTPVGEDDRADLSSVYDAAMQIAKHSVRDKCVIITAQVPVGTSERVAKIMEEANPDVKFDIVYMPEFLRLGTAVETFRKADRFVIGANDPVIAQQVAHIYKTLNRPILMTNIRSAEMGKHASNTFLALSIGFINELADLCDEVGADALDVAKIMKLDKRIGKFAFLSPGLGFAGGTLGRDVRAIQEFGKIYQLPTRMMDAIMAVNETRVGIIKRRLVAIYGSLTGLKVGIWGLTYKPGTSTLRRSMALSIIESLVTLGVEVAAFDPLANLDEVSDLPQFQFCEDPYMAVQDCDAVVLVTEWEDIKNIDFVRIHNLMKRPVFIDTRNLFQPEDMQQKGFIYSGIGRGTLVKG